MDAKNYTVAADSLKYGDQFFTDEGNKAVVVLATRTFPNRQADRVVAGWADRNDKQFPIVQVLTIVCQADDPFEENLFLSANETVRLIGRFTPVPYLNPEVDVEW